MSEHRSLRNRPPVDYTDPPSDEFDSDETVRSDPFFTPRTASAGSSTGSEDSTFVAELSVMDESRIRELTTELETIFFQLDEIVEDVGVDLNAKSLKEVAELHDELKGLRISMVKFQMEFKQIDPDSKYVKSVTAKSNASKEVLKTLTSRMRTLENVKVKAETEQAAQLATIEDKKEKAKQSSFVRAFNEIQQMYVKLNAAYTASPIGLDRAAMLKRNTDKPVLAAEFDRFRERVDNLIQTEVLLPDRESYLDKVEELSKLLETNKTVFEKKVYDDLVVNDLTVEKMKLAEQTKIDIGKFSGTPGEDFYTFKSKFLKAYSHHPQSLKVDYLKNNHLSGKAKDSVGSLEELEGIWVRLKSNFGNTEQMLLFHFAKINHLGPMKNQKTFTNKKHYLQSIINAMQDAIEVATEHGLEGEIHYGPQLGHVVSLLETRYVDAWWKIVSRENIHKTQRWQRFIIYLEAELSVVQTRAFESESAELRAIHDQSHPPPAAKRPPSSHPMVNTAVVVEDCELCDEKHPNANKGFLCCKRFLKMSQKERCEHVKAKKRCVQCLETTVSWNDPNHVCSEEWICQSQSHAKYNKKLHVLLCEYHTGDDANKQLFKQLKKDLLKAEWQKRTISGFVTRFTFRPAPVNIASGGNKPPLVTTPGAGGSATASIPPALDDVPTNVDADAVVQALDVVSGTKVPVVDVLVEPAAVPAVAPALDVVSGAEIPVADAHALVEPAAVPAVVIAASESVGGHAVNLQLPNAAEVNDESLELGEFSEFLPDAADNGAPVMLLQPVPMYNHVFNFLFDSGCQTMVSRKAAVDRVPDDCKENVIPGPLHIRGVGDTFVTSPHGHYKLKLPIYDGRLAVFSGMCLDVVTGPMPPYPIREARKSICDAYVAQGGDANDLPQVPVQVGGETDILLGTQYNWYQPRLLFILPTGLAIYKSVFLGVDGTRGCIGGSHEIFTQCEMQFMESNTTLDFRTFLAQQLQLFNSGFKVCLDHDSLAVPNPVVHDAQRIAFVDPESENQVPTVTLVCHACGEGVNDADDAGSCIRYRCVKCRGCSDCKSGGRIEQLSLKEEWEQHKIESSVSVDFEAKVTSAVLPFIADPVEKLESNQENAIKIYNQQIRKLSRLPPEIKEAVLDSERKLQDAKHVQWVKHLPDDQRQLVSNQTSQYFMPWRFVHNENSTTTPTRIVFDASSISKSGYSLNDLLAKGVNNLNSLLEIFLRFRCYVVALHTDIKKMYNVLKMKPDHWTYQRYYWQETLSQSTPPEEKVIMTVIYGARPSGNQATVGLRITAKKQQDEYPAAVRSVVEDSYVDDCGTGIDGIAGSDCGEWVEEAEKLARDIDHVIGKGGFITKGYTMSGKPPLPELSKDGVSVSVLGTKWVPEPDTLKLACGPLNFAKKVRGKRQGVQSDIPVKLTKRICTSKVAELFDVSGLVTPLMASFKLDIRDLLNAGLGWDDEIPSKLREVWVQNFKTLEEIGDLEYRRAVIPPDAASLDVELIGAGDASARMVCAGCYIRFRLKDGGYSCQLILAKSKIVAEDTTLPRAEFIAEVLNIHITEVVKRSLRNKVSNCIWISDSVIALCWATSQTKRQKPWVRNRAIEINRFSKPADWYYVPSALNPADLGTRKGASLQDVSAESEWIKGKPWMTLPLSQACIDPLISVDNITLKPEQVEEVNREMMDPVGDLWQSGFHSVLYASQPATSSFLVAGSAFACDEEQISTKVQERLQVAQYLFDPNRYRFSKTIRVMALVIRAAKIFLSFKGKSSSAYSYAVDPTADVVYVNRVALIEVGCLQPTNPFTYPESGYTLADADIQYAMDYFSRRATLEVKAFNDKKVYENISFERNGILHYTGRVLTENITFRCSMTDAMLDLSCGSFVVPLVDRHSPLAYCIVDQVHWYHRSAKHSGVETTIRHTMNIAHILGIRDLSKLYRKQCLRCRYLLKRTIDVEMAPAAKHQLCVAPPYYVSQVDLCGPFKSYSSHHRRTTVKIWILTLVCSTTGMTNLKVMEGYDTSQFLLAFSRFSCEVGFPKVVLIDPGSQLVSGCEGMVLNMCDIRGTLNREHGIEFTPCPVGGHNFHGKVERKIKAVQESIEKSAHNERLSVLQWETLCSEIANAVNNLPIAIGNETENLELLDLITPNRLKLGRNNERSPVGPLDVTDQVDRLLRLKSDVFNSWWEAWLTSAVPKIMPKPKWFKSDVHLKVGDVVLFNKVEGSLGENYRFGMVESVRQSSDGHVRAAVIRYRNASEGVDRTTVRAVRSLVVIHRLDELNIAEELGRASLIPSSTSP